MLSGSNLEKETTVNNLGCKVMAWNRTQTVSTQTKKEWEEEEESEKRNGRKKRMNTGSFKNVLAPNREWEKKKSF